MNKNEIIQYAIIAIIIIAVIVFLEDSELKDTLIDIFNDSLAQMNVDRERRRFRRLTLNPLTKILR